MLRIEARIEGGINLDKIEVKVNCPRCQFSNPSGSNKPASVT